MLYTGRAARGVPTSALPPPVALCTRMPFSSAPHTPYAPPRENQRAYKRALPSGKTLKTRALHLITYQNAVGYSSSICVGGTAGAGIVPNVIVGDASACCCALLARSTSVRAAFCAIHSLSQSSCEQITDAARGREARIRSHAAPCSSARAAGSLIIASTASLASSAPLSAAAAAASAGA